MANSISTTVVTAIHGSDFESFCAGTLYSQGWNVLHRALDWNSLCEYIDELEPAPDVLLISTDLEGLDHQRLNQLIADGMKVFIFRKRDEDVLDFPQSLAEPQLALELIGLIRGSIRKPMVRSASPVIAESRAHVLAIAGAHSSAGCTSLSINIAVELSLLGKKVLLIDANSIAPAIAILLGQQGLHSSKSFQKISTHLWALEITQENIPDSLLLLESAKSEFDYIVLDSGTVTELARVLRGKRWTGEMLVWIASHADELWFVSKSSRLALERLRRIREELSENSMKPAISFVQSMSLPGKRSTVADEAFSATVKSLNPKKILHYPLDARAIGAAESEQVSLYDSNEKSLLRKSVAALAGEIGR